MKLVSHQLRQCIWLISTIRSAGRITFENLCQQWKETEMSGSVELNRTTFNRMRDAVQEMFGVIIDCEKKGGYHYYIYNQEDLDCPVCSPKVCPQCVSKKMAGRVVFCKPQHCIFTEIEE